MNAQHLLGAALLSTPFILMTIAMAIISDIKTVVIVWSITFGIIIIAYLGVTLLAS